MDRRFRLISYALAAALTLSSVAIFWVTITLVSGSDSSDRYLVEYSTWREYSQPNGSMSQILWRRSCFGLSWREKDTTFHLEARCAGIPFATPICSLRTDAAKRVPCPSELATLARSPSLTSRSVP